jgi:hypothetical protein
VRVRANRLCAGSRTGDGKQPGRGDPRPLAAETLNCPEGRTLADLPGADPADVVADIAPRTLRVPSITCWLTAMPVAGTTAASTPWTGR